MYIVNDVHVHVHVHVDLCINGFPTESLSFSFSCPV